MFVKVLHMREMNGIYGHLVADEALIALSEVIKANLREVDFIARSGSSFYVVMPELRKEEAESFASKVAEGMDEMPVAGREVTLNTAIGVTAFPDDGDSERVLIQNAEQMVRESVRKGGNAVTVFRD
jgi:polar amino acid transport system substrate-binding protein